MHLDARQHIAVNPGRWKRANKIFNAAQGVCRQCLPMSSKDQPRAALKKRATSSPEFFNPAAFDRRETIDRGAHYRWHGWLTRIGNANLVCSVSRRAAPKITPRAKSSLAS